MMNAIAPISPEPALHRGAPALLLRRSDIVALMRPEDWIDAVEAGFRRYAEGAADVPHPMHIRAACGSFHAKGARLGVAGGYVAVKLNANYPDNARIHGLPTIQGVVLLCDATDGTLLAIMDAIEITLQRTAAASALAARYLARPDADTIAICGCGAQSRAQLVALARVLSPRHVFAWDIDAEKAHAFAVAMSEALGLEVRAVADLHEATLASGVIVTTTTARTPFLTPELVAPGTFVAAVGADNPDKSELAPALMATAMVVVDSLAQAATMGDLHHAIAAGSLTTADAYAELGDIVIGRKTGRATPEAITVFDSTGLAVQDVASAASIYERARACGAGSLFDIGA